jgi:hypothetical protein
MKITPLVPKRLPGGMVADVYPASPETGGFDLVVWRSESRDDGLHFAALPDLRAVRKHINLVVRAEKADRPARGK